MSKEDNEIENNLSEKKINSSEDIKVYKEPLFNIGDIVKHRIYPFRGVIIDVDPEFSNTEEWYQSIPAEIRPSRNQPYYHLMAENTETFYTAYVSQQNLVKDGENGPLEHPDLEEMFSGIDKGKYQLRNEVRN
jgi:heat shock protein HspQ